MTVRVRTFAPALTVTSRLLAGSAAALLMSLARDARLLVVARSPAGDRIMAEHTGPVMVVRGPGWPPEPRFGDRPLVVLAEPVRFSKTCRTRCS